MAKKALFVIDMLNEFIYGNKDQLLVTKEERRKIILNIRKVITIAHKKNIPVIYVNCAHKKSDPCIKMVGQHAMKGTKGAETIDELKPTKKDYIVEKISYDGFYKTNLERLLKKLKIKEIYLTGVQTDCCVRETATSGAYRGFKVFIIADCCGSNRKWGHKAAILFMKNCVGGIINSNNLKWL
jgi:nicotinamidase-related amidase